MPANGRKQQAGRRIYRGRTPEQYRSERRERLFDAALDLFSRHGYAQTPISELCSAAGVSTRHFYQLYPDRDSLLCALFDRLVADCGTAVQSALRNSAQSAGELVDNAIRSFIEYCLNDIRRARLLCLEIVGVSDKVEAHRRKTVRQLTRLIADQAAQFSAAGTLPQRDYYLPALMLTGAVNELMVEHLTADTPPDADQIAHELRLFFRAMIIGAQNYPNN